MPVGAAWGSEANRATVLAFTPKARAKKSSHRFAQLRWQAVEPASGDLWCVVNERDALGDDLVPDYATRVRENSFYGWPWYYWASTKIRVYRARAPISPTSDRARCVLQAHSAPLHIAFYDAATGSSVFPLDYRGDAFIALHGSWNRGQRTGTKSCACA